MSIQNPEDASPGSGADRLAAHPEAEHLVIDGIDIVALPKISLHDHLDGGLRPATIIELADAAAVQLPTTDPTELGAWFKRQSVSGDLVEYLKTFDLTIGVMQTADNLARVATDAVLDLAADGVIYGELRWAPEQHVREGLTLDEAVEAVQAGIEDGIAQADAAGHHIQIGQLISAMRHLDRSQEIAELALRHRDRGVAGFDIAGPEAGFPASRHRAAFDTLAAAYLPVTVHAGEADGLQSIAGALFDGRALRLGHGVRIAEDIRVEDEDDERRLVTLGPLGQWVKDRRIALETSPTSNLDTGAFAEWGDDMLAHPFDLLYQLGFTVTVNTDNRLMSATSLSRELALLAATFGYDLDDLETFQLNAVDAAFASLEEREDLAMRVSAGFEGAARAAR